MNEPTWECYWMSESATAIEDSGLLCTGTMLEIRSQIYEDMLTWYCDENLENYLCEDQFSITLIQLEDDYIVNRNVYWFIPNLDFMKPIES